MTPNEFLIEFENKLRRNGDYIDTRDDVIRQRPTSTYNHCPLSYVAGTQPCHVEKAAKKLGMSQRNANLIARASDGPGGRPLVVALRQRLIGIVHQVREARKG